MLLFFPSLKMLSRFLTLPTCPAIDCPGGGAWPCPASTCVSYTRGWYPSFSDPPDATTAGDMDAYVSEPLPPLASVGHSPFALGAMPLVWSGCRGG